MGIIDSLLMVFSCLDLECIVISVNGRVFLVLFVMVINENNIIGVNIIGFLVVCNVVFLEIVWIINGIIIGIKIIVLWMLKVYNKVFKIYRIKIFMVEVSVFSGIVSNFIKFE